MLKKKNGCDQLVSILADIPGNNLDLTIADALGVFAVHKILLTNMDTTDHSGV